MEEQLIAPCGMNCSLCVSYQSRKNDLKNKGFYKKYCSGCLPRGENCNHMKEHCDLLGKGLVRFCYECEAFPCNRLKSLDKRYRSKYHMSMIENLKFIKENGIEMFLEKEAINWHCPECDGVICCHNGLCMNCRLDVLRQNKKYRWGEGLFDLSENKAVFNSMDEYILQFSTDVQRILQELRLVIKDTAPEAEEKISYQMPTFYLHGNLVHFAAYKNHIGFYPTPTGIEKFKDELSFYKSSKGSVQFPINEPVPFELIRKIVEFRVGENQNKAKEKSKKK